MLLKSELERAERVGGGYELIRRIADEELHLSLQTMGGRLFTAYAPELQSFCRCGYSDDYRLVFINPLSVKDVCEDLSRAISRKIAASIAASSRAAERLYTELANIQAQYIKPE